MLVLNRYCTERIHRKSFFLESVEIKTPIRFSKRKISKQNKLSNFNFDG